MFEQIVPIIVKTLRNTNLVTSRCFKMKKTSLHCLKSVKHKRYRTLTQTIRSRSSVAVQFGIQLFILSVHFYSFRVEVNGIVKISFPVFVISFVFVNLCNCYRAYNSVFIKILSLSVYVIAVFSVKRFYLTIIPRVRVGFELAIITSYRTSASGIIV